MKVTILKCTILTWTLYHLYYMCIDWGSGQIHCEVALCGSGNDPSGELRNEVSKLCEALGRAISPPPSTKAATP